MELPKILSKKNFLNFRDVMKIYNLYGNNFDINNSDDYRELKSLLLDLILFEHKLTAVLTYTNGLIKCRKSTVFNDEQEADEIDERFLIDEHILNAKYILPSLTQIRKLFNDDVAIMSNNEQITMYYYWSNSIKSDCKRVTYQYFIGGMDQEFNFNDLRFPKWQIIAFLDDTFLINSQSEAMQPNNHNLEFLNLNQNSKTENELQITFGSQAQEPTQLKKENEPKYTTTAITALNHVVKEFWENWEIGTIPPKQEYIVKWITDNYPNINPTMAKRIEQIARHETAK